MTTPIKKKWIDTAMATDTELASETTARQNADTSLQTEIDTEETIRANADTTLQNNINSEASTRSSADTTLQNNINAEATTRGNADTNLQGQITTNTNNISSEVTNRTNADTTLQNNINAEASTRSSADTTLQNNINAEQTARQNADTSLQSEIDTEETTRASADTSHQNQITTIVNTFQNNVRATVMTGISFLTATAVVAADTAIQAWGKLQAQITRLFALRAMIYETSRATTASTSSTATWITYLTLTTPALDLGDYECFYQWFAQVANNGRSMAFRVTVNSVVAYQVERFTNSASQEIEVARFLKLAAVSGVQTINFEFRVGTSGNTTVTMNNMEVTLKRVGN